jgi:polyisoprenoid-binding protein YceI
MSKSSFYAIMITLIIGMASCKNKDTAIQAQDAAAVTNTAKGKRYTTNGAMSDIRWSGSSPGGSHNGSIKVSEGEVFFDKGKFQGSFTIDMNTLNVLDLEGDEKKSLEEHLKGTGADGASDFFNVTKFPTAKFEILEVIGASDQPNSNSTITGNLTMLGITKLISFPGNLSVGDEDIVISTNPFTINRTDWGIKYGSKTFFQDLKDKFIDDNITLQISLRCMADGAAK